MDVEKQDGEVVKIAPIPNHIPKDQVEKYLEENPEEIVTLPGAKTEQTFKDPFKDDGFPF